MLQFKNETGFAGTLFASPDPEGVDSLYTVVKGTFDLSDGVRPADEQVPVALVAEHYGDPASSSVRVPSDVSLVKPGADVLLLGSARAPGGRPVTYLDVALTVGPVQKYVRVFGDRYWEATSVGYAMSPPAPFESMPLIWERAYGGSGLADGAPTAEMRNPVGSGFHPRGSERTLHGLPLPNLEDPFDPIEAPEQSPAPACCAPVAAHWQPRIAYAGTYDERWQRTRAPYLPSDFDPHFFQLAPPGLVAAGYFNGGEMVEVRGVRAEGPLVFRLPEVRVRMTYVVKGSREERSAKLDTVIVMADELRLILIWRAVLACDKTLLRVNEVQADLVAN